MRVHVSLRGVVQDILAKGNRAQAKRSATPTCNIAVIIRNHTLQGRDKDCFTTRKCLKQSGMACRSHGKWMPGRKPYAACRRKTPPKRDYLPMASGAMTSARRRECTWAYGAGCKVPASRFSRGGIERCGERRQRVRVTVCPKWDHHGQVAISRTATAWGL